MGAPDIRQYAIVTGGYWAFTITDGAIRMLVVLYFHQLGYSPFEVAMLFLLYEFFGVVTNLTGGWLAARFGLNRTMNIGMLMQVGALAMLTVPDAWLSVAYVMAAQALSGIAKDLNKMSAKASVKLLITDQQSALFKWVAILTGSKNALKGVGFFVGAALLQWLEFRGALVALAGTLFAVSIATIFLLPGQLGQMKNKPAFKQVFSNIAAINWLAASRFFLFGSRDVWFVVGLPVFLYEVLDWSYVQIGSFMAYWIIGYGFIQASAPKLLQLTGSVSNVTATRVWAFVLALFPAASAFGLISGWPAEILIVSGLTLFAIVFALNSALHSYLILAYSEHDKVALNVGFYYMANAGGRLIGTILSGLVYQWYGLTGCLWISTLFVLLAAILSLKLPQLEDSGRAA